MYMHNTQFKFMAMTKWTWTLIVILLLAALALALTIRIAFALVKDNGIICQDAGFAPSAIPCSTNSSTCKYPLNVGQWSVENENLTSCVLLKGAFEVSVTFAKWIRPIKVDVPVAAIASGICEKHQQSITLAWITNSRTRNASNYNTISLLFNANHGDSESEDHAVTTKGSFALDNVTGVTYAQDEPINILITRLNIQTPLKHSYNCSAEETLRNDDGSEVLMKIKTFTFEAFRKTPAGDKKFSESVECAADGWSPVLKILGWIGIALACFILLCLINPRIFWALVTFIRCVLCLIFCCRKSNSENRLEGYQNLDADLESL